MLVVYLSIQFSDNACDISVNPFYANEWDSKILFYLETLFDYNVWVVVVKMLYMEKMHCS